MKHVLILLIIALVIGCSSSTHKSMQPVEDSSKKMMKEASKRAKEPVTASQKAMVEKLLIANNSEADVADMHGDLIEQLQADLNELSSQLGEEKVATLQKMLTEKITKEEMCKAYRKYVDLNYDPANTVATLKWLESPIGQKNLKLEGAVNTPEGEQGLMAFAETLESNPASAERIGMIQKLMSTLEVSGNMKEMAVEMLVGSVRSTNAALPKEERVDNEQLSNMRSQMEMIMGPQLEGMVPVMLLYTYKDASDAELSQIIEFYNSPTGQWFSKTELNALKGMMTETFGNVFKAMNATSVQ